MGKKTYRFCNLRQFWNILRSNLIVMCLFLLPLKINKSIKDKLLEFGPKNANLITFSKAKAKERPGGVWDALLAKWIKKNRGDTDGSSTTSSTLNDWMSNLRLPSPSQEDVPHSV